MVVSGGVVATADVVVSGVVVAAADAVASGVVVADAGVVVAGVVVAVAVVGVVASGVVVAEAGVVVAGVVVDVVGVLVSVELTAEEPLGVAVEELEAGVELPFEYDCRGISSAKKVVVVVPADGAGTPEARKRLLGLHGALADDA